MKQYNVLSALEMDDGRWVRFTDHEAAIKKAVEDERETIVGLIRLLIPIPFTSSGVCEQQRLIEAIRQRGAQ